jgi:iron complex outermembrane receptor protein
MSKIAIAGAAALLLVPCVVRAQQTPSPTPQAPDQITLPEVSVSAPRVSVQGYLAPESRTALKVAAAIQDIPASVQVVPQALIQDRGALTVRQALDTVSGVESSNALPGSLAFRIRSFIDSGTSLRDGFRETSNQQDIQGVDRIEVLKGPASVLYGGTVSSGGVVNIVTKAPVDGTFVRTGLTGGSFGFFRSTVDANQGDVTGDGPLAIRWNAAYDRSDTFRRFGYNEDTFVNPTIRWRPTSQDEVIVRAQYLHSNFSFSQYQSPIAQKVLALPLSFSFVDPNLSDSSKDAWRLGYDWTHTFDSGLKFRSGFNASIVNYDIGSNRFLSFPLAANGRTLSRTATEGPQTGQDLDFQNELSGTFHTGPFRHEWLTGVEVYRSLSETKNFTATLPALNLLNPVYDVVPGRFGLNSRTRSRVEAAAGYVQDFVAITPQLRLLVGGRYDATDTVAANLVARTRSPNAANQFSPASA